MRRKNNINRLSLHSGLTCLLFSLNLGFLATLHAQNYGGMPFILRDLLKPEDKSTKWIEVSSQNTVFIDGKNYTYQRLGMKHYILPTKIGANKREVLTYLKEGKRFISIIIPISQNSHNIIIQRIDGVVIYPSPITSVPSRTYLDEAGQIQFDIILQDVMLIRDDSLNNDIPVVYDAEFKRFYEWIGDDQIKDTIKAGKIIHNFRSLYIDKYGSIWNSKNCIIEEKQAGALFREDTKSSNEKSIIKIFYLSIDNDGKVIPQYLNDNEAVIKTKKFTEEKKKREKKWWNPWTWF